VRDRAKMRTEAGRKAYKKQKRKDTVEWLACEG